MFPCWRPRLPSQIPSGFHFRFTPLSSRLPALKIIIKIFSLEQKLISCVFDIRVTSFFCESVFVVSAKSLTKRSKIFNWRWRQELLDDSYKFLVMHKTKYNLPYNSLFLLTFRIFSETHIGYLAFRKTAYRKDINYWLIWERAKQA